MSVSPTAYAAIATGARLSFAIVQFSPITVADSRDKANTFRRSSILFQPPMVLVELPGTAPGSDPLITRAFMSIVPKDRLNICLIHGDVKGRK